ncbi:MAG: DUF4445 domain-containing protein [Actinobacteria bacterium]|nr:DUF4445 domain-containing protein [Actinomycetota bacterium]
MEYRIDVQPLGKQFLYGGEDDLLTALHDAGIDVESVCGGMGSCGKCRIHILEGKASDPTPQEGDLLSREQLAHGERFACQVYPQGDLSIYIPASSLTSQQKLQLDSQLEVSDTAPAVYSRDLEVEIPTTPGDPGSDLFRVEDALRTAAPGVEVRRVDLLGLRDIPKLLRENGGKVAALLRGEELLGLAPAGETPLGLAVDLGSTKVALFLYDLSQGIMLASRGFLNPQIAHGEDIVTRIQYAIEGNAPRLMQVVVEGINAALSEMLAETGHTRRAVCEMVLVGNTAMHHLFLGLPVEQLGKSPYLPATDLPLEVKARELGLELNPAAVVYMPPPIAGYVGSDHLAALAAARLWDNPGPCLLLDIGTNTEVALKVGDTIRSCSCASGPAFEGGGLSQGMRAGEGAIEGVSIDAGGKLELAVIGNAPPEGICGSGILGAMAALVAAEIVDASGRILEGVSGVERRDGELVFYLSPPGSDGSSGVAVTQNDIREIQKAKGAIRAGIDALLAEAGLGHDELREIILAGAFGTYIDPAAALSISLLPPVTLDRIKQVGNAAGAGARSMLLSTAMRSESEEAAGRIEYLELSSYPTLSTLFAADMYLSEKAVLEAKQRFKL